MSILIFLTDEFPIETLYCKTHSQSLSHSPYHTLQYAKQFSSLEITVLKVDKLIKNLLQNISQQTEDKRTTGARFEKIAPTSL